jgi:hypothetical protein
MSATITEVSSALPDNSGVRLAELPDQPDTDAAVQRALRDIPGLPTIPRPGPLFSSSI